MIGGYIRSISYSKTVAKLDSISHEWSKAGGLNKGRWGHNTIFDGTDIIVVGGYSGKNVSLKTEKCTIAEDKITCVEQEPSLVNYYEYPELFLVGDDFCKEWSSI